MADDRLTAFSGHFKLHLPEAVESILRAGIGTLGIPALPVVQDLPLPILRALERRRIHAE
jgi:hypothetical protein